MQAKLNYRHVLSGSYNLAGIMRPLEIVILINFGIIQKPDPRPGAGRETKLGIQT